MNGDYILIMVIVFLRRSFGGEPYVPTEDILDVVRADILEDLNTRTNTQVWSGK